MEMSICVVVMTNTEAMDVVGVAVGAGMIREELRSTASLLKGSAD